LKKMLHGAANQRIYVFFKNQYWKNQRIIYEKNFGLILIFFFELKRVNMFF